MPRQRIPLGDELFIQTVHASQTPRHWPKHDGQWVVYTIYESQHRIAIPLYVGVTKHIRERLQQHRAGKVWWPLAGDITVHGYFDTRADGYEAEEQQIHALQPLLNYVTNTHGQMLEDA